MGAQKNTSDLMIFATLKEGLFKKTPCVISFFPDEILLTLIPETKVKSLKAEKKARAMEEGAGKMKASFMALSAVSDYAESIREMDIQMIREEEGRSLPRTQISGIRFSSATERESVDTGSSAAEDGKLLIKLSGGRLTFSHRQRDPGDNIKSFLRNYAS